jgi:hypothetical protein
VVFLQKNPLENPKYWGKTIADIEKFIAKYPRMGYNVEN